MGAAGSSVIITVYGPESAAAKEQTPTRITEYCPVTGLGSVFHYPLGFAGAVIAELKFALDLGVLGLTCQRDNLLFVSTVVWRQTARSSSAMRGHRD